VTATPARKERLKGTRQNETLELTVERARRQALDQFKYARTCMLARELCYVIRMERVVFEREDVHKCCRLVSELCKEAGCDEACDMCAKAAEAVLASEETYLELCEQSCKKCSESRQPKTPQLGKTTYVA